MEGVTTGGWDDVKVSLNLPLLLKGCFSYLVSLDQSLDLCRIQLGEGVSIRERLFENT